MRRITIDLRDTLDMGTLIGLIADHMEAFHMETVPDPAREVKEPPTTPAPNPVATPPNPPKAKRVCRPSGDRDLNEFILDHIKAAFPVATFRATDVADFAIRVGYAPSSTSKALAALAAGGHVARTARGVYRLTTASRLAVVS